MKSKITKEELEQIKQYQDEKNFWMHQLLCENAEDDIAYLLQNEGEDGYSKTSVEENLDFLKKMFTVIAKYFYQQTKRKSLMVYQSSNVAEIEHLKRDSIINPLWIGSSSEEQAKEALPTNSNRAVMLQFKVDENIPYVEFEKQKILMAPFTNINDMQEISAEDSVNKTYEIALKSQEFEILAEEEKNDLYQSILENAENVQEKLKICAELEEDNRVHYEEIRKLEQLLAKHHFAMEQEDYEEDTTENEKQSDLEDVARINEELASLKETIAKTYQEREENINFIIEWKRDVIAYLKDEFRQIQEKYASEKESMTPEEPEKKEEVAEEPEKELAPEVASVKAEVLESIAVVDTLRKNIKELISKQQNHARIAEMMDSNYKALNNAFEMKNFAEELDSLLHTISNKLDHISPENAEELEQISKTNIQVSILLNYLNNAKSAVSKKITRFCEMSIIEENELKREMAETIKNIRCEAELRKLRDDVEIIEDKSTFKKLIGRFTGRNKLDETMLEQIEIRQTAIRKTFKTKMPLSYNYSIHELLAEIEMFIEENEEDELVVEDVSVLRKIKEVLKKNFVIMDSKVVSIMDQKSGKNLPLSSQKMSRKELIEIDTYRFLHRYGYDKSNDVEDPEYQDTMANEIKRIVDYIKTSGII